MTVQSATFTTIIEHAFDVHVEASPMPELVGKTITSARQVTIANGVRPEARRGGKTGGTWWCPVQRRSDATSPSGCLSCSR